MRGPRSLPARPWPPAALPVLAIAAAFGLVLLAAASGGTLRALVDLPSLAIVIGGTAAATVASFEAGELARLPVSLAQALGGGQAPGLAATLERGLGLAALAHRDGLLALERHLDQLAPWPVLRRGLRLAIDGNAHRLEPVLEADLGEAADRDAVAVAILRRAAEIAPAAGLIGTLLGLVRMLGQLDRPEAIGASMALALLTTLYGALAAHLLLLPLAERIGRSALRDARQRRLELRLACAIAAGESPLRLRDQLAGVAEDAAPPCRQRPTLQHATEGRDRCAY